MDATRREFIGAAGLCSIALVADSRSAVAAEGTEAGGQNRVSDEVSAEPIIEPDLPIVDPHHHLWCVPPVSGLVRKRYLFEELMADLMTGHNVRATVYVEAHSMYRARGPEAMRSVGEVEFANGVAAMGASQACGDISVCAGIVGNADLRLGDRVEEVLLAHIHAGGGRYRGVRNNTVSEGGLSIPRDIFREKQFRAGFNKLQYLGLSFDVWVEDWQFPEVTDLACAFSETQIILNHLCFPTSALENPSSLKEQFPIWRNHMRTIAKCTNVAVKLGGLGMFVGAFKSLKSGQPIASQQLATEFKPYIETCIDAFGADRCMFESNFPVDAVACSYPVLWNALKRTVAGASNEEKAALCSGTATRLYRLGI